MSPCNVASHNEPEPDPDPECSCVSAGHEGDTRLYLGLVRCVAFRGHRCVVNLTGVEVMP